MRPTTGPLARVLAQLAEPRRVAGGWTARCPAHDDTRPSLSISEGRDGRVLLKCQAGCEQHAVVLALGLRMADLFTEGATTAQAPAPASVAVPTPTTERPALVQSYPYIDEDGRLLFEVCRMQPKGFRQRRPDPSRPGDWLWSLGETRRVLYRLPEVLAAAASGATVYVVEGEKDADLLTAAGFVATTNAGGATKWHDDYSAALCGADVVVLPDHDESGERHAARVASSCHAAGVPVRICRLPGLPPKGDVSDWVAAGGTWATFAALVADAPRWQPSDATAAAPDALEGLATPTADAAPAVSTAVDPTSIAALAPSTASRLPGAVCLATAPDEAPVRWLLVGALPRAEPALVAGPEGQMKTTFVLLLACAIAAGGRVLGLQVEPDASGPVLLVSGEDPLGVVRNRCMAICRGHGWNVERVLEQLHFISASDADLRHHAWQLHLRTEIAALRPTLVVLDPLAAIAGGNENAGQDREPVARFWGDLARASGATVLLVHHAGKTGDGTKDKRDRIRGHTSIPAGSRATFFVETSPDQTIVVENLKQSRAVRLPPFVLEPHIESDPAHPGNWTVARFERRTVRLGACSVAEKKLLTLIGERPGLGSNQLAGLVEMKKQAVSDALASLQAAGLILYAEGPNRSKLWHLTPSEGAT